MHLIARVLQRLLPPVNVLRGLIDHGQVRLSFSWFDAGTTPSPVDNYVLSAEIRMLQLGMRTDDRIERNASLTLDGSCRGATALPRIIQRMTDVSNGRISVAIMPRRVKYHHTTTGNGRFDRMVDSTLQRITVDCDFDPAYVQCIQSDGIVTLQLDAVNLQAYGEYDRLYASPIPVCNLSIDTDGVVIVSFVDAP